MFPMTSASADALRSWAMLVHSARSVGGTTKKFARIASAVSKIKATSCILDGEAVVVDSQGRPSFQMLQNRSSLHPG